MRTSLLLGLVLDGISVPLLSCKTGFDWLNGLNKFLCSCFYLSKKDLHITCVVSSLGFEFLITRITRLSEALSLNTHHEGSDYSVSFVCLPAYHSYWLYPSWELCNPYSCALSCFSCDNFLGILMFLCSEGYHEPIHLLS